MMESPSPLLRRYRSDRRKLLEFLLSSTLVSGIKTPAGPTTSFSDINFDSLSADYLLECIQSGRVFDVSEATKRYYDESSHPIMIQKMLSNRCHVTRCEQSMPCDLYWRMHDESPE